MFTRIKKRKQNKVNNFLRVAILPGLVVLLVGCSSTKTKVENNVDYSKYSQQDAPLATQLNDQDEYEFALDLASLAIERKQYSRAEGILHKARKVNPQDVRIYRMLAKVYEAQDNNNYALVAMQQANKQATKTVEDESELGRLALMQDKFVLAENIYQSWLTSTDMSRQVSALNNLGFSALLQKKYVSAKIYFEQALQKDPLNTKARNNLLLLKNLSES
jgi:Tfp pilus assembly protein PilF